MAATVIVDVDTRKRTAGQELEGLIVFPSDEPIGQEFLHGVFELVWRSPWGPISGQWLVFPAR